jgi:hypothetical protein
MIGLEAARAEARPGALAISRREPRDGTGLGRRRSAMKIPVLLSLAILAPSARAASPRFHVETDAGWFRPGISYALSIDDPAASVGYRIIQIDLPFVFK